MEDIQKNLAEKTPTLKDSVAKKKLLSCKELIMRPQMSALSRGLSTVSCQNRLEKNLFEPHHHTTTKISKVNS